MDAEKKRFEAALRIYLALLQENLARPTEIHLDQWGFAEGAVIAADQLLAELRKEKKP